MHFFWHEGALQGACLGYLEGRDRGTGPSGKIRRVGDRDPCVQDVSESPPSSNTFDVICVSFYLERTICQHGHFCSKANGLLFYQTFIHEKVTDEGPSNPAYRLGPNELLGLFSPLHVLAISGTGACGEYRAGGAEQLLGWWAKALRHYENYSQRMGYKPYVRCSGFGYPVKKLKAFAGSIHVTLLVGD